MNLCAWVLSTATTSYAVLGGHPFYQLENPQSSTWEFGIFEALIRIAWPAAVCYIIFACVHNCGGPVNWFLSQPLWQPFSRLSYAIYLIHFPLMQILAASDTSPNFEEMKALQFFFGVCVLSTFVAIPATLAFVSPIDAIDRFLSRSDENVKSTQPKKV